MQNLTDEELLLKYQNAESDAFEAFYHRNKKLVFHFLRMKLGNTHDAEEVLQETFFRIHRYILKYKKGENALSWVFTIAKNAAIDKIRKNARKTDIKKAVREFSDAHYSMDIAIEAKSTLESLLSGLEQDEILLLQKRFMEDSSYEEIALEHNSKPATIRKRVSRLISKIKTV